MCVSLRRSSLMARIALAVTLTPFIHCRAALAQCTFDWKPTEAFGSVDGLVYDMITWDPDGAGPQSPLLVVGGLFKTAGNLLAPNIAAWDGAEWHDLGGGTDCCVAALAVHQGKLVAAGGFTSAGGVACNRIATWDGVSWQPLGAGLDEHVESMAVYNGSIIAGGWFENAGGVPARSIARWDGVQWSAIASGVTGNTPTSFAPIYALTVFNNQLIAGGQFTAIDGVTSRNVARWNGTSWIAMSPGIGTVNALAVHDGALIAGGHFKSLNPSRGILRWTGGSWELVGNSLAGYGASEVLSFGGKLYVGGGFRNLNCWDGLAWTVVDNGMDDHVTSLCEYNGMLVAGGHFNEAGDSGIMRIAMLDDDQWRAPNGGMNEQVLSITSFDNHIVAGGEMLNASNVAVNGIAQWDGDAWLALGSGIGTGSDEYPLELTTYGGELIVGGGFTSVSGLPIRTVARWNGSEWLPWGNLGGRVLAFAAYEGDLIIGGTMTLDDGRTFLGVMRWTGDSWAPMGVGLRGNVFALQVFQGTLYAGGSFTTSSGAVANRLAKWNGTEWQQVPGTISVGPTDPTVRALAVYEGSLIVGGTFTSVAGMTCNRIAKWDGQSWSALGTGLRHRRRGPCCLQR